MFNDKSVLITGGTGSFGKAFFEIILRDYRPKRAVIFSRDEQKQHEMRQVYPEPTEGPVRYFIGDVRDRDRLYRAFRDVDIVIHAAAMKQVPSCEYNPIEAIQTNIIGAKNVIDAAIDQGVKKVMAISTDKAVNPISLYGATKLCEEKLIVQGNTYSGKEGTRFSCCRYGNVLGSRGSVIPLFKKQRESGKITVTDKEMTRFWITPEEGALFAFRCIEQMRGGEVFVPKIPSMRLVDLAKAVAPGCDIEIVGIRAGEKLHEQLISRAESRYAWDMGDMFVIQAVTIQREPAGADKAKRLPENFEYTSDNNDNWLSIEDLRKMI